MDIEITEDIQAENVEQSQYKNVSTIKDSVQWIITCQTLGKWWNAVVGTNLK
ncbi:hypothetical protein [Eubacterium aggregans]|uniref:hypothetical protein n=1 Tax=Eubacterium aggregans TaxID=81409 RepID=UPI003F2CA9A2